MIQQPFLLVGTFGDLERKQMEESSKFMFINMYKHFGYKYLHDIFSSILL
jgi:hypothetical protein